MIKKAYLVILVLLSLGEMNAQKSASPIFSQFIYSGSDDVYRENPLKENEFYTSVLQGCYPDPSITRNGNNYFMVCSSFSFYPGVPIFHSTDLVNWKQIGHVLDRPSQLKVSEGGVSDGVYAPDIMYNPHNDTFYMITTQVGGGLGNMVVKTKDPFKGWSDPYKLNFGGIDPAMFFDDDGKAYVIHNDGPEKGKAQYGGHRVIKIWEYDLEKDQVISGTDKVIVDGGVNITQKPHWIEAPHIYKRNRRYYLMCAEGGTREGHSEVIFVADHPKGPYIPAKNNPILTQRYLSADRKYKVDWAGHADLVETPVGEYYGVFLAIRPNAENRVNTGRETFILPVDWSGEFPVFENGLIPIKPKIQTPKGAKRIAESHDGFFPNGNFTFTDNFADKNMDYRWFGIRGSREEFTETTKKGLKINPFPVNIKDKKPTSTLFYRQQHNVFRASVTIDYKPASEKDLAGIVCYQNENFNYLFGIIRKENKYFLVLQKTADGKSQLLAETEINQNKPLTLQVEANNDVYKFNFSYNGQLFTNIGGELSGDILSSNIAKGFTGALIGLHATSANDILP